MSTKDTLISFAKKVLSDDDILEASEEVFVKAASLLEVAILPVTVTEED